MKSLHKLEASQRDSENCQAFTEFQQTLSSRTPVVEATPTERYGIYIHLLQGKERVRFNPLATGVFSRQQYFPLSLPLCISLMYIVHDGGILDFHHCR